MFQLPRSSSPQLRPQPPAAAIRAARSRSSPDPICGNELKAGARFRRSGSISSNQPWNRRSASSCSAPRCRSVPPGFAAARGSSAPASPRGATIPRSQLPPIPSCAIAPACDDFLAGDGDARGSNRGGHRPPPTHRLKRHHLRQEPRRSRTPPARPAPAGYRGRIAAPCAAGVRPARSGRAGGGTRPCWSEYRCPGRRAP